MPRSYFVRLIRKSWVDGSAWARDNLLWAAFMVVILPVAVYLLIPSRSIDWLMVRTSLWLYLGFFLFYGLFQLVKSAWKLDKEHLSLEDIQANKINTLETKESAKTFTTSKEWEQLGERFRPFQFPIRADFTTIKGITTWDLKDGGECKALCMRAGAMLLKSPAVLPLLDKQTIDEEDHVIRWLTFIKKMRGTHDSNYATENLLDGTKQYIFMGSIQNIQADSLTLCIECAAHET